VKKILLALVFGGRACKKIFAKKTFSFLFFHAPIGARVLEGNFQHVGDGGHHRDNQYSAGLPDFYWYNIPKRRKIYKITTRLPNAHKICPIVEKYSK
jgi:hypothetical protein